MRSKIGTVQAVLLIFNAILPTATIVLPSLVGASAGQDSGQALMLSFAFGLLNAWIVGLLIKESDGAPLVDWIRNMSPLAAWIAGLLLLHFYLDTTATILREFINFIKDNLLLHTPVTVVSFVVMLITFFMAVSGIEAMARVNTIICLLYLVFVPIYTIGLYSYIDINRLLPMFDHSAASIVVSSLPPITWVSEVAVLLFLAPYLKSARQGTRIGIWGLSLTMFLLTDVVITSLLVFGPNFVSHMAYPGYSSIGVISFGRFFERMDIVFLSYWIVSIYMKLAIFLFVTLQIFKQTFRVKKEKPFLLALTLIIAAECIYTWEDPEVLLAYNQSRYFMFALYNAALPLAILLWSRLKRAGQTRGDKRKSSPVRKEAS